MNAAASSRSSPADTGSSGCRPAARREVDCSPLWGTLLRVQVVLSRKAEKQLSKLPGQIVKKLALWVDLVSVEGLVVARAIPGYRDHALRGEWSGYRAIRLSAAYRAIDQERQTGAMQRVHVEEVNKHDY